MLDIALLADNAKNIKYTLQVARNRFFSSIIVTFFLSQINLFFLECNQSGKLQYPHFTPSYQYPSSGLSFYSVFFSGWHFLVPVSGAFPNFLVSKNLFQFGILIVSGYLLSINLCDKDGKFKVHFLQDLNLRTFVPSRLTVLMLRGDINWQECLVIW